MSGRATTLCLHHRAMSTDAPLPLGDAAASAAPATPPFPPGERIAAAGLLEQLGAIAHDPLLDTLLTTIGGLLAVLNEQRQLLVINEALLAYLGVGPAEKLFGLRLGEAFSCPHADETPGGCGTTRYCRTCGAAIAQALALQDGRPAERLCFLESEHRGLRQDLVLRVRATPLKLAGRPLILLFIDDVTRQQQQALAARSFQHDLGNTLTCLLSASELLLAEAGPAEAASAAEVHRLTERVINEFALQRQLVTATDPDQVAPHLRPISLAAVLDELRRTLGHHPAARSKRITVGRVADRLFATDAAMLLSILLNMGLNALEATHPGGEVRLHVSAVDDQLEFSVWNEGAIPAEIALRIFQRNFSTKAALGRGLGTYSMKLVGERLLRGRVWFQSDPQTGTTFFFRHPTAAH